MKKETIIAASLLLLAGCRSPQTVSVAEKVETRTTVDFRIDTVTAMLPAERMERTTRDSVSVLSTSFATSTVRVDSTGFLHHVLRTNPDAAVKVPVQHVTLKERTDSTSVRHIVDSTTPRTEHRSKWTLLIVAIAAWFIFKQRNTKIC